MLVTHHVEEIPAEFSHVLLMRAGRVVGAGPIRSTLSSATLSDCFGLALELHGSAGRFTARAR